MNVYKSKSVKACLICPNRSNVTDSQTIDPLQRITYHKLPVNIDRRDRWLEFCGQTKESFVSLGFKFVCSNHFEDECFERDLRSELLDGIKRIVLKKNALPTIRTSGQQLTRRLQSEQNNEEERNRRKAEIEMLLTGEMPAAAPIVNPFRKHLCSQRPKAKRKPLHLCSANGPSGPELLRVLSPLNETEMLQRIAKLERTASDQGKLIAQLQRTIDQKTEKINFAKAEMVNIAISLQEIKEHGNRHVSERVTQLLSDRFSKCQVTAITANSLASVKGTFKDIPWSNDDLANALELRCISKEAFRYVLQRLHYPFPDAPQIERWIHCVYLQTGINETAFRLLKLHAASLTRTELVCSLNISHTDTPIRYHYDRKRDQIFGPGAQLHCVAVQGIFSEWIQLVHLDFDLGYSHQLLEGIIAQLHQYQYRVVAITTGCDSSMVSMWTALGICNEQHFIRHPVTEECVYMFVCPDGVLNAIHRILVDDGFVTQQNNVMITKNNVMTTLTRLMQSIDPRIAKTLVIDQRHISGENLDDFSNLPRELISHSTSNALRILANEGGDDDTLSTLATLFDIFIEWYELCTASLSVDCRDPRPSSITQLPYGSCEDEQNIILDAMFDVMENFRCTNADKNFLPEAVLISINSMRKLLIDLRREYTGQISYLPLQRLGTSAIRDTITNFRNVLKNITVTRIVTGNEILEHLCHTVVSDKRSAHVSNRLLQRGQLSTQISSDVAPYMDESSDPDVSGVTEQNVCWYLTKLLATRLAHKYEYLGERIVEIDRKNDQYVIKQDSPDIADSAVVPSALWSEQAKRLESYMNNMVQERTPALAEDLVNRIHNQHPQMGRDIIEMYVMKRIAIQLRILNEQLGTFTK